MLFVKLIFILLILAFFVADCDFAGAACLGTDCFGSAATAGLAAVLDAATAALFDALDGMASASMLNGLARFELFSLSLSLSSSLFGVSTAIDWGSDATSASASGDDVPLEEAGNAHCVCD